MNWYKRAQFALTFQHIHEDYHNGQHDYVLAAYSAETQQPVGMVEYSLYQDDIYINNMLVKQDLRRQKIGTQMIEEMKREYPDSKINWGMMTPDGSKLYNSISNPENISELV